MLKGIFCPAMSSTVRQSHLNLATFNCRSVKSSVNEVKQLCDSYDSVMLQEHWLLPHELSMLSVLYPEFLAVAESAVNVTHDILVGRPYGGTAILYRREIAKNIKAVASSDPRISAVIFHSNKGPVLMACVYMPVDNGDIVSLENYIETCATISALISDTEAVHVIVAGDF